MNMRARGRVHGADLKPSSTAAQAEPVQAMVRDAPTLRQATERAREVVERDASSRVSARSSASLTT